MSQVAFNINGEPFDPSPAALWRVRRVRDRGLEVAYKKGSCTPLFAPVDITPDEFQRLVDFEDGKYRLDPLDEEYKPVEGVPPAYLVVKRSEPASSNTSPQTAPDELRSASGETRDPRPRRELELSETGELLRMVVKANAKTTRTIAKHYSSVLDAAARVLAADGSNLPARQAYEHQRNAALGSQPAIEDSDVDLDSEGDDDGDDLDVPTWLRVINVADSYAPVLKKIFKVDDPAARNANPRRRKRNTAAPTEPNTANTTRGTDCPSADPAPRKPNAAPRASEKPRPETANPAAPAMTAEMGMHFIAIKRRLTDDEVAFLKSVYGELTEVEVAQWMHELSQMTVEEAVAKIRAQIAEEDEDINQEEQDDDDIDENQGDADDANEEAVS